MIHSHIEFHNCADLVSVPEHPGLLIQRVPEALRLRLNPGAQQRVRNADNVDLRFTTSGESVSIELSAEEGPAWLLPYWGDLPAGTSLLVEPGAGPQRFEIAYPERMRELEPVRLGSARFDRTVWRIEITGRGSNLYFHSINGESLAPPESSAGPQRTLLTYGTSITHGAASTRAHLSYAAQTARLLGMDLINLGVGGSCHAEPDFADYIAARTDWDVAVLALSVNMIGAGFTVEEFSERVEYMVSRVAGADTSRPVYCITIYPHFRDLIPGYRTPKDEVLPHEFREALEEAVESYEGENAVLIRGPEILDDPAGLAADLIHPSDFGMTIMAKNLAERIGSDQ